MDHAAGGTGHSGVVVQHAENQRFEYDGFLKLALHAQDGGAGEVEITLGVATNGAAKAVGLQPVESLARHNGVGFQETELLWPKTKLGDSVEQACGASDHAIAPSGWQVPGEHLEDGSAVTPP